MARCQALRHHHSRRHVFVGRTISSAQDGPPNRARAGPFPKPTIWAEPDSVIIWGRPVTIWCQASLEAEEYHLSKAEIPEPWVRQKLLEPSDKAKFSIVHLTQSYAGKNYCYYHKSTYWSAHSDSLDLVVTGFYTKSTLSALPSPMVTSGGNLTLQCGSWLGYDRFVLSEEGKHIGSWSQDSQQLSSGQYQAVFTVVRVTSNHRGTFKCYGYFKNTPHVWLKASDILELLISGMYGKPFLLSQQGPIVVSGDSLTFHCGSDVRYDRFALSKEGTHDLLKYFGWQSEAGLSQVNFPLGRVNRTHGGKYRCYGGYNLSHEWSAPSDPLDVLVTGELPYKPFLWVWPNLTVASGDNVTFQLFKEDVPLVSEFQNVLSPNNSLMAPVTPAHAGIYRCYGSSHHFSTWSEPSDALEIGVTGLYRKPSLTAQLGPGVMSGGNVTLCCRSESSLDVFHLVKEGEAHDSWFSGVQSHNGTCQADFSLGPMTPALGGAYRCYGSFQHSPYEWSEPSDPLVVSAPTLQDYTVENLIRMGGAGLTFVALLVVLAEAWWGLRVHSMETEETS
ncbi:leukocyte immunoglobulin-like receptor subfamily B member 3 [Orycteropus afer afer]|uniref:Leukocyte immunoglobulin-like receptor subfamily B member 3 n=1 Tax=Orycteropus afer afer TaxID=1230840 RepID=A0AC54ZEV2_ORYAF|nr:leukocyte immunoglobulin-like receptor subfamily B member 3 [Orycteropus afer afer]